MVGPTACMTVKDDTDAVVFHAHGRFVFRTWVALSISLTGSRPMGSSRF
jgi:hypothetical protein